MEQMLWLGRCPLLYLANHLSCPVHYEKILHYAYIGKILFHREMALGDVHTIIILVSKLMVMMVYFLCDDLYREMN